VSGTSRLGLAPLSPKAVRPTTRAWLGLGVCLAVCGCLGAGEAPPSHEEVSETSDEAISANWCAALPRAAYAELVRVPVESDWFEVWEAGEGVLAIYEPKQWQEVISYLVLGTERALLFDTGMGIAVISDVVDQLTEFPVIVLNSHTHLDHIGGNAEFSTILGMDTDFTRARSEGLSNAQVRQELEPAALCGPLPAGVSQESYRTRPWTITQVGRDGHSVDLGGRTVEILHIPGHTPDAIALLDTDAGYLWTGDSFYEGPIWLFAPETDLERYEQSVRRLADLVPRLTRVFPAHNTPVVDPSRLVELREAVTALREGRLTGQIDGEIERYDLGSFSLLLPAGR